MFLYLIYIDIFFFATNLILFNFRPPPPPDNPGSATACMYPFVWASRRLQTKLRAHLAHSANSIFPTENICLANRHFSNNSSNFNRGNDKMLA